ncbi:hexitol phosphatase HxpB [Labilibaculum euxinus]|uniref:Hexitol phosphatase HxpB n=1 Tax=Labilibaculum euxinus TaxID=2686357 RepID=A0A7M4D5C7_9BACT|nr:hexitol phosphatase HxpB [Labilibaculum euxinus]MUP37856.1 hexitol phosphatase HxpB [Labilibaculum euxinus]MVB07061.1 hexitol phosphatase HxpB [Labilibaculum euxinus]
MIKAVIFDMDGLLINSEPFWQESETKVFSSLGLDVNNKMFEQFMGKRIDEVVEVMYNMTPWNHVSKEKVTEDIVENVIRLVLEKGACLDGVNKTLENLQQASFKIGLASSSKMKIISAVLEKLQLQDYFEVVHSAEFEKYGKPHPQVFITTAELLGIPPSECLVFEDSLNGVISALAAGMKCIAVPEKDAYNLDKFIIANKVLGSLNDFEIPQLTDL